MAASIIENLHRKNMNSKDMAESCNFLTEKFSSKTKAAKALDREAILQDLDAVELATKIVSDWIAREH